LGEDRRHPAEQIYTGSGRGEEKKAYVLNWLQEHSITVDAEKLDALIEAAVYDLTNNGLIAIEQGVVVGEDDGHEAG
ncbi:MAG: phage holin, LLH family, partial [Oscillospiraceae bacterium]|nr:phage holin, LLH family [Oscillospiraceae bacterium]